MSRSNRCLPIERRITRRDMLLGLAASGVAAAAALASYSTARGLSSPDDDELLDNCYWETVQTKCSNGPDCTIAVKPAVRAEFAKRSNVSGSMLDRGESCPECPSAFPCLMWVAARPGSMTNGATTASRHFHPHHFTRMQIAQSPRQPCAKTPALDRSLWWSPSTHR